jgi:hypothetical protein
VSDGVESRFFLQRRSVLPRCNNDFATTKSDSRPLSAGATKRVECTRLVHNPRVELGPLYPVKCRAKGPQSSNPTFRNTLWGRGLG